MAKSRKATGQTARWYWFTAHDVSNVCDVKTLKWYVAGYAPEHRDSVVLWLKTAKPGDGLDLSADIRIFALRASTVHVIEMKTFSQLVTRGRKN